MRTKHILTALALPALFAACTADEFETVNPGNGLQEERAKVGEDFTLLTSGVQTRYSAEGGAGITFSFDEGDQIGAAIIDKYNTATPDDPATFDVIYSLAGNNPFEYKGNDEWQSNTELGIGHYMFVYPYNRADNGRGAVSYELPVIQKMYTDENGKQVLNAAIEDNTNGSKAVAAAVLTEGQTVADISLKNLYTYPKLVINFDNGEKVTTVSQIVLKADKGSEFIVKGGFNHRVVADLFAEDGGDNIPAGLWDREKKEVKWDEVGTYDFLIKEGDADYDEASAYITADETEQKSEYIIVKFPNNTKVQLDENTKNKYVEARVIMPSIEDFTNDNDITLYAYTDNGIYKADFKASSFSFKNTTSATDKKEALWRNKSNALNLDTKAWEKVTDENNIVTTIEDWNNLVDNYGDHKLDEPLPIAVVGDEFAFDATAKWPTECVFEINTDVNVDGDVEIENVTVNGTINVKEGATLTVNNTLEADKILNKGVVEIEAEAVNKVSYSGVDMIRNEEGVLNIAETADATFKLQQTPGSEVTNNGKMTLTKGSINKGTINNNGLMRTEGLTNEKKGKENGEEYEPTIENAKDARILSEDGTLLNKGLLVNEGTLTCQNRGGVITNEGTLDSKANAITYITTNADGKVIVYSANTSNVTISDTDKGIVEYETVNASESFKGSLVNSVIATKTLTITEGSINLLTFKGSEGTLTLGTDKTTATVAGLAVEKGTLTLASDVTVSKLIVEEGAEIIVPAEVALTYGAAYSEDNFRNDGRILVGGVFNAEQVDRENGGLVENNGGKSEINWAETDADVAEAKYNAALRKMVQAWMLNAERNSWDAVSKITGGDWTATSNSSLSGTPAWNALATAAYEAYNEWQTAIDGTTVTDLNTYLTAVFSKEAAKDGRVANIIAEYKKYGDDNRIAAFKDKYSETSWLDANWGGFYRSTADTKVEGVVTKNGTKLVAKLAEKMAAETSVDFAEESTTDPDQQAVQNKAIVLSLAAVTDKDITSYTWVPDYSYVSLYEGSQYGEYEVMKGLLEFQAAEADAANKVLNGAALTTVEDLKAALAKVVDAYNEGLGYTLKRIVENYDLTTRIDKVYDEWKFNNKQIEALHSELSK